MWVYCTEPKTEEGDDIESEPTFGLPKPPKAPPPEDPPPEDPSPEDPPPEDPSPKAPPPEDPPPEDPSSEDLPPEDPSPKDLPPEDLPEDSSPEDSSTEDSSDEDSSSLLGVNLEVTPTRFERIRVREVCKDILFKVLLFLLIIIIIGFILHVSVSLAFIFSASLGSPYTKIETSTHTNSFIANYTAQAGVELFYAVYIGSIKGYERSKVSVTTDYEFQSDNITIVLTKELKKKSTLTTINQTLSKPLRKQYAVGEFNYTVNLTGPVESLINISVSLNDHVICSSGFPIIDSSSIPFNCTSNKMGYYGFDYMGSGTQKGVLTYEILDVEYYNKMATSLACVMYSNTTCLIQLSSKYQGIYHIIALLPPYHVRMDFKIVEGRSIVSWLFPGVSIAFIILTIILLLSVVFRVHQVIKNGPWTPCQ